MKILQALILPIEERGEIRSKVGDGSRPGLPFYTLLILSAAIAAFGLLIDSTAVVIGAMLVAPLMGPIFGIALGLITGSRKMTMTALFAEATGVAVVIGFAMLVAKISPINGLPTEVLARTSPNIFDIFIALASGLAGAYATVSPKVGAALPGVAISTSLVPPLASAGICWAAGEWRLGAGAFLLFFANFLAIDLAAAAVFAVHGLGAKREAGGFGVFFRQYGWSALLLVVMSWFFVHSFIDTLRAQQLRSNVTRQLDSLVRLTPGANLEDGITVNQIQGRTQVIAAVLTPRSLDEEMVAEMEAELRKRVSPDIDLIIRSLISTDRSANGPVFLTADESQKRSLTRERADLLTQVREAMETYLVGLPGAQLEDVRLPTQTGGRLIVAVVNGPTALTPSDVSAMEKAVSQAVGTHYNLHVRTVLAVDATADSYLFREQPLSPNLTPAQTAMRDRIAQAVQNQVRQRVSGAEIKTLNLEPTGDRWQVKATVRTPQAIGPEQVAEIQALLRRYVAPNLDLTIKSVVEADASATGYLRSGEDAPGD